MKKNLNGKIIIVTGCEGLLEKNLQNICVNKMLLL